MNIEQLLSDFTSKIDVPVFMLNLVVATILSYILARFYVRYGNAVANREKFANNFIPLALTTVLIITIIKSSIALSLGLVGALSIVRFRAAIKDPEELIYLFLVIAIGLAAGADYALLAAIAIALILILLFVHYKIQNKAVYARENVLYVNINTDVTDVQKIVQPLETAMEYVELKRMDRRSNALDITFICKAADLMAVTQVQEDLIALSENTTVSMVDQPDLIV